MIGRTNSISAIRSGDIVARSNYISNITTSRVREITSDGTNIYFSSGYSGQNRLTKMNLSTMATTSVITDNYSGVNIFTNGDYIYLANTYKVYKYLKSDLSLDSSTIAYGGTIGGMVTDGTYLYVAGSSTKTIRKYALTDLTTLVAESSATGYNILAIAYDDGYVYIRAGVSGSIIYKYDTATLTLQATSVTIHYASITKMIVKGDYVLITSYESVFAPYPYIDRLDKATLQTYDYLNVATSTTNLTLINNIYSSGSNLYVVGTPASQSDVIYAVKVSDDLTSVTNLLLNEKQYIYGSSMFIDTNYIYYGSYPSDSIFKIVR